MCAHKLIENLVYVDISQPTRKKYGITMIVPVGAL